MDIETFYGNIEVEMVALGKLGLTDADKKRFKNVASTIISEHPGKISPNKAPNFKFKEFKESLQPRSDTWKSFLLSPADVPVAPDIYIEQLTNRLGKMSPSEKSFYLEPVDNVPNIFRVDIGSGQRLLITVKPDSVLKTKNSVTSQEFESLLKSSSVTSIHLDAVSGEILTIPQARMKFGP